MADYVTVSNGRVNQVFHGHKPRDIEAIEVQAGTAAPGMTFADGVLGQAAIKVEAHDVRREARRRILIAYPWERQASLQQDGGAERDAMLGEISRLRLCSRALCRLSPIPADYREDRYWQGSPLTGATSPTAAPQAAPGAQVVVVPVYQPAGGPQPPAPNVINISGPPVTVTQVAGSPTEHASAALGQPPPMPPAAGGLAPPPGPALTAAPQPVPRAASGVPPSPEQLAAPDPIRTVNDDVLRSMEEIWPQAKEVAAEHAARAMKGSDEALELIAPQARAAGLEPAAYCQQLLFERVAAHRKILEIDGIRDSAIEAIRNATDQATIDASVAAARHAIAMVK